MAGWADSVAQQSGPSRPLSPSVVINPPRMSHSTEVTNVSAPNQNYLNGSTGCMTFLNATARCEYSQETINPLIN